MDCTWISQPSPAGRQRMCEGSHRRRQALHALENRGENIESKGPPFNVGHEHGEHRVSPEQQCIFYSWPSSFSETRPAGPGSCAQVDTEQDQISEPVNRIYHSTFNIWQLFTDELHLRPTASHCTDVIDAFFTPCDTSNPFIPSHQNML